MAWREPALPGRGARGAMTELREAPPRARPGRIASPPRVPAVWRATRGDGRGADSRTPEDGRGGDDDPRGGEPAAAHAARDARLHARAGAGRQLRFLEMVPLAVLDPGHPRPRDGEAHGKDLRRSVQPRLVPRHPGPGIAVPEPVRGQAGDSGLATVRMDLAGSGNAVRGSGQSPGRG